MQWLLVPDVRLARKLIEQPGAKLGAFTERETNKRALERLKMTGTYIMEAIPLT